MNIEQLFRCVGKAYAIAFVISYIFALFDPECFAFIPIAMLQFIGAILITMSIFVILLVSFLVVANVVDYFVVKRLGITDEPVTEEERGLMSFDDEAERSYDSPEVTEAYRQMERTATSTINVVDVDGNGTPTV